MRRRIPEPISLAPDTIIKTKNGSGAEILEAGNMTQMVGVLQQLGLLATYSHELLADLSKECEASFTRINKLKTRLGGVTERLSRVDDALGSTGEEELAKICASNPGGEYKLQHTEANSLFTPASRPPALQATFDEARAPPPLHLLDPFVERDPAANKYHKYGLEETCLDLYSDPNFFLKQCARPLARAGGRPTDPPTHRPRRPFCRWLDEEEEKRAARKASCFTPSPTAASPRPVAKTTATTSPPPPSSNTSSHPLRTSTACPSRPSSRPRRRRGARRAAAAARRRRRSARPRRLRRSAS